jgi:hypothetical protein
MGQDGEDGEGRAAGGTDLTPPRGWDPARELERDRRVERRLLGKELAVVVVIAALLVLREVLT